MEVPLQFIAFLLLYSCLVQGKKPHRDSKHPKMKKIRPDESFPVPDLDDACVWPEYKCNSQKNSEFRTIDGSCNNLKYPLRGRSGIPLTRVVEAEYGDGIGSLRLDKNNKALPNEREISFNMVTGDQNIHPYVTQAIMVYGQFFDHDVDHTPTTKIVDAHGNMTNETCGDDGCDIVHPACSPIPVPDNDYIFTKDCVPFVRSRGIHDINCASGKRQQVNLVSSFIDGSNVYGSTKDVSDTLRDFNDSRRGPLLSTKHPNNASLKNLLPQQDTGCVDTNATHRCFRAGDVRANEHHGLTIFHTIFMREHNRIEKILYDMHKNDNKWDGERLFQTTRKIVGAELQHITYNEYLPVLIGKKGISDYGLDLLDTGYYTGYDEEVDASTENQFATASFRYGHSTISDKMIQLASNMSMLQELLISEQFFRPSHLYAEGSIDALLRGIVYQESEQCDRFMTPMVTTYMFTKDPPFGLGLDLFTLNTHRGRDHGLPGYNRYREYCNFHKFTTWKDMKTVVDPVAVDFFKRFYKHPDDVDLFPAVISEKPVQGAMVGPTVICLLSKQFVKFRNGDRYWYENKGREGFTKDQLQEIRKSSLSGVICRNSDNIKKIQPNAFLEPFRKAFPTNNYADHNPVFHGLTEAEFNAKWATDDNKLDDCSQIPDIDFSKW